MAFEIFDSSGKNHKSLTPMAVIRADAKLRLNHPAVQILKAKNVKRILLLWDPDKKKIGITPGTLRDARSYKVSYNSRGNSADVAARAFVKYIGFAGGSSDIKIALSEGKEMLLEGTVPAESAGSKPDQ